MDANLKIAVQAVEEGQEYTVVVFNGEFDKAGFAEVSDSLEKIVEDFSTRVLIFDFTHLKFINSEGIGYLMEVHTHLVQRGRSFVLLGLNAHIEDVFKAVGIHDIIPVYNDLAAYLNQSS